MKIQQVKMHIKNSVFIKSLGADVVIDYNKIDFSKALQNIDAFFKIVESVETEDKSFKILKKAGSCC